MKLKFRLSDIFLCATTLALVGCAVTPQQPVALYRFPSHEHNMGLILGLTNSTVRWEFQDCIHKEHANFGGMVHEEVIAWALQEYHDSVPPDAYQEVIVVETWRDTKETLHYDLGFFDCFGPEYLRRTWQSVRGHSATKEFDHPPSSKEIADFIHQSNFGYNDYDEIFYTTSVAKVVSYRSNPDIMYALSHPVSRKEKGRRLGSLMERF